MAIPKYLPIDCNYYDRLEHWATLKEVVLIESRSLGNCSGVIIDLYTTNGMEFLRLDNNIGMRLDDIIAVNGIEMPGQCEI